MYYPIYHNEIINQRADILESYSAALSNDGRRGTGGHSDPTAVKGAKLAELGESTDQLEKVIDYMNTLKPFEREVILTLWRCGQWPNWGYIANHMKLSMTETRSTWAQLVKNFQAFVGIANDPVGDAYANGQPSQSRE